MALAATVALAGCGSSGSSSSTSKAPASTAAASTSAAAATTAASTPDRSARLGVVASTDVYGDIVEQIAGDRVDVTSIITDPSADPHSYEANTQNQLALSKADIVVENGGGYDDFIDTMLKASNNDDVTVLNVVDISGFTAADGGELNEHVWYDFGTIEKLTDRLVSALSAADPAGASAFQSNATSFKGSLQQLRATEATIKQAHGGTGVAITEPVPLYMLEASGLVNKTPAEFSEAIEEGSDVPPAVLKETLDLFSNGGVKLLAYNEQTSGPETEQVLAAAKANQVAVVPVTETLPAGMSYISWMTANLAAILSALA
ncbi:MAG: zinc ABC transporter substrate-binding protein [Ilumatobacteraceae bacterium]